MPRYIDAELAVMAAQDGADEWDGGVNRTRDQYIECAIDKVPTADVVPVKHGHWIKITEDYDIDDPLAGRCSVCGWAVTYEDNVVGMNYCPNCGSAMDGENDG